MPTSPSAARLRDAATCSASTNVQKLASRAWISVERHLYNGGSPRFISSRRGLHSIEGKTNRTGIIWKADQQCVTVCKRVYRVRVDKRDDWLTRALQDQTDPTKPRKVKYCRIVRSIFLH